MQIQSKEMIHQFKFKAHLLTECNMQLRIREMIQKFIFPKEKGTLRHPIRNRLKARGLLDVVPLHVVKTSSQGRA